MGLTGSLSLGVRGTLGRSAARGFTLGISVDIMRKITRNTGSAAQRDSVAVAFSRHGESPGAGRSAFEREQRIREVAYLKAAARGFRPGHEWHDWLEAEREVDALVQPVNLREKQRAATRHPIEGMDHRQGVRTVVRVPVKLDLHDGRIYHGFACDLSADGMFLRTPVRPHLGCCLDIRMPGPQGTEAVVPVYVVHRSNGGLGLMFRGLDDGALALVRTLREIAPDAQGALAAGRDRSRRYG